MAVTAQAGVFSFGGQSAKGTVASTFYQHRAADIDLATISDDRLGPPEVGGIPTPTIPYRAGVLATGGATISPRLENTFGWLLEGAVGAWSATTDENVFGTATTNMFDHEFVFATNQGFVPYMSFRKEIPGAAADGSDDFGETFEDCKIIALTLALPNDGLISTRVDVLGRVSEFVEDPTWTYGNTQMEDWDSIPIGCVTGGFLKIPTYSATELPVVQATVTLTNAPLDIRQEKVFGDPYIQDVTVIGRSLTVDMLVKWDDPDLYQSIITGSTTGTQWTATPFTSDLDIYTVSTIDAPTTNPATPWQLRVRAAEVMYQAVGGIRLAGNNALMQRVTGTAIAPSSGEYVTINLGNTVNATAYTWPT
ncbi:MAG: hypothetical protein ACXACT_15200 [Candidatus Thorarchaeota archaeon]|jgi:hypothetical protein